MPLNYTYSDQHNNNILISHGTNATENIELIKASAQTHSWWLHLDTVASGHTIIHLDQHLDQHLDVIRFAAHICYNNISKKKQQKALYFKNNQQHFSIILTKISNLLIDTPGLQPGEVEFKSVSRKKLHTLDIPFAPHIYKF